jgi:SAM-dependent methyltransferase
VTAERRGALFDRVAELYDRVRPDYPAAVYDDLEELAGLSAGARVLEIGCGSGQATQALAERGARIVAVELGPALAELARRRLARFAEVEVVVSAFEDWPLPDEPFDLVVAATSFHWLDAGWALGRVADALRPGGALATIATHHVAGGTAGFFAAAQECYLRWDPETTEGLTLPAPEDVPCDDTDLRRSGRFGPAVFRHHERDIAHSTAGYLDVLRTYSGSLSLEPQLRDGLLDCLGRLADERFGGRVVKRYLWQLMVARTR